MCFYINIVCPGNCGQLVVVNELVAACKLATTEPQPDNFDEIHVVEHGLMPLLPRDVEYRFPSGYVCSDPTCSHHPNAVTTTTDISNVFRCPGCGAGHSKTSQGWVETWVARDGIVVPFLDRAQWPDFACTQRLSCHFNLAYAEEIHDKFRAAEAEMVMKDGI